MRRSWNNVALEMLIIKFSFYFNGLLHLFNLSKDITLM